MIKIILLALSVMFLSGCGMDFSEVKINGENYKSIFLESDEFTEEGSGPIYYIVFVKKD